MGPRNSGLAPDAEFPERDHPGGLDSVWDRGEYYRVIMHARWGGFAAESLTEHEEILRALEAANWPRETRAVETHRLPAMERLAETT